MNGKGFRLSKSMTTSADDVKIKNVGLAAGLFYLVSTAQIIPLVIPLDCLESEESWV